MKNQSASKIICSGILVSSLLMSGVPASGQSTALLIQDYPQSYVVQDGDNLTDIASKFLRDPGNWSQVWMPSPYAEDETIYPGDTVKLEFVDGRPRLTSQRGNLQVERMSPQMREIGVTGTVPEIALDEISSAFSANRIVDATLFDQAPYVLAPTSKNLVIGTGDEVFARGEWPADGTSFEIYRNINQFDDPDGTDRTWMELETVGFATVVAVEDDGVRRLAINSSDREIKVGDRLLTSEEIRFESTISPTEPDFDVSGLVLAMTNTERMASQLDTILMDLGSSDGLRMGDVVSIEKMSERVVDETDREGGGFGKRMGSFLANEKVTLPGKEVATVLVYRVFDHLSYGIILSSAEPIRVGDRVVNP